MGGFGVGTKRRGWVRGFGTKSVKGAGGCGDDDASGRRDEVGAGRSTTAASTGKNLGLGGRVFNGREGGRVRN